MYELLIIAKYIYFLYYIKPFISVYKKQNTPGNFKNQTMLFFFALFLCLAVSYPLNTIVVLNGLSSDSFNGKHAIIEKLPTSDSNRYGVLVQNPERCHSIKLIFIKEENIFLPAYPIARKKTDDEIVAEFYQRYPAPFFDENIVYIVPSFYFEDIPLDREDISKRMSFIHFIQNRDDFKNPALRSLIRLIGSSIYEKYGFCGLSWAATLAWTDTLEEIWDGIGVFKFN